MAPCQSDQCDCGCEKEPCPCCEEDIEEDELFEEMHRYVSNLSGGYSEIIRNKQQAE